jgi:23S rRNA pseudouridine1911/1915/1917 synthase
LKIQKEIRLKVPQGQKKLRIDKYLALHIENSSRTKIQKAIDEGSVLVNSKKIKSNYLVQPNDDIEIYLPKYEEPPEILPEDIKLDIVYEDANMIVTNKPAGMVTHPAYKNHTATLVNALLFHISKNEGASGSANLSGLYGHERAGIVHRLDKNTSGLLVIAKDEDTHRKLSKLFSIHNIEREYWAIVWGKFKQKKGIIEKSLGRSSKDRKKVIVREDGKHAVTEYEVLQEFDFLTLVKLTLQTGRTHQIRVHMHSIGHPVFGDPDYEGRKPHSIQITNKVKEQIKSLLELIPRQALHAKVLGFTHPQTGEKLRFESELPDDMQEVLAVLTWSAQPSNVKSETLFPLTEGG